MSMDATPPAAAAAIRPGGWLKRGVFIGLMTLLVLPALQGALDIVPVGPLGGFFDSPPPPPTLSMESLRDNTFQSQTETRLELTLGFRSWLLRLRNQLAFSLFGQSRARSLIVGKDDQMYGSNSVNSYLGRDFMGEEDLRFRCKRLKRVQDSLQAHGTQLLLVLAPGKARILPEQLPDTCRQAPVPYQTNYSVVRDACRTYHINLLDATQLLQQWKDTASYPLFPRGGVHWSGYAVTLVADTLFRRLEQLTQRDLPDFAARDRTVATRTSELRFTDNDLQELFNLIHDVPPYPVAYPTIVFGPQAGKTRLNALVIGDSFAQSFYGFYPYYQHLFTPEARYWSSFRSVDWPADAPESHEVRKLNLGQQLAHRDVVLFICTEQNLPQLGFGFFEAAFDYFCPRTAHDQERIAALEHDIRQNPEWLRKLTQQAEATQEDINKIIHDNALYMQDRER